MLSFNPVFCRQISTIDNKMVRICLLHFVIEHLSASLFFYAIILVGNRSEKFLFYKIQKDIYIFNKNYRQN